MLQRIGIAQALINDPHLVLLDEPMSGLDPIGRKDIRDLIFRLKEQGKTIFFSSHILHDAEVLCDRVAILVKGRVVASGPVGDLVRRRTGMTIELVVQGLSEEGLDHVAPMVARMTRQGDRRLLTLREPGHVNAALDIIRAAKATLVSLTPQSGSLEDLFMKEVGEREGPSHGDSNDRGQYVPGKSPRKSAL